MFRFIPVLAGVFHLLIATLLPGTSTFWDLVVYNGLLLTTSLWLLLRGQQLMAAAIGSWTVGSLVSAFIDLTNSATPTTWSGIGFLALYPLLFFYIIRSQQLRRISRTQIIDSLIITLGLSSLIATLALAATATASSMSEIFLLTLYPIGDLLLLFLLILIGLRTGVSREYLLLFLAIIIFTVSDIGYLWLYSKSNYFVGGLVDEGWLIALLLCATCPKLPNSGGRTFNTYPPIFIALGLALSMLGWFALNRAQIPSLVLIPSLGTLLLAFIRMALALEEAEQGRVHRQWAVTDELTGVGNRRDFLTRLSEQPEDGSVWLLLLDLDGFKAVNDELGHSAGDRALREIAHRFRAALPDDCHLARLGGDEFGVLIPGAVSRVEELKARLKRALATPLYFGEHALNLGVSIGRACIDGASAPLEQADAQMYEAKRSRR